MVVLLSRRSYSDNIPGLKCGFLSVGCGEEGFLWDLPNSVAHERGGRAFQLQPRTARSSGLPSLPCANGSLWWPALSRGHVSIHEEQTAGWQRNSTMSVWGGWSIARGCLCPKDEVCLVEGVGAAAGDKNGRCHVITSDDPRTQRI